MSCDDDVECLVVSRLSLPVFSGDCGPCLLPLLLQMHLAAYPDETSLLSCSHLGDLADREKTEPDRSLRKGSRRDAIE